MSVELSIDLIPQAGFVLARLTGTLRAVDAPDLTDALIDHAVGEGARLAIDLSTLDALDSSGLGALIQIVTRARMTGGRVVLVAPSSFVSGVFEVTNLNSWFEIFPTPEDAAQCLTRE